MPKEREPFIVFRVLIEHDPKYSFYVAHCLQTGSVVTADDVDTAEDMMKELLEDEISYAVVHNNLKNLMSTPAPLEIWRQWSRAAAITEPKKVKLNITAKELRLDEPEMVSEVKVARTEAAVA
jgi:hypothetical protein